MYHQQILIKVMFNTYLKIPFLIFYIVIIFVGCSKDDAGSTNGKTTAVFNPDLNYGTLADLDGNVYKTITIGNQVWMAENLRVTTYNDGSPILKITETSEWSKLTIGAYCNYNNTTNLDTIATFGCLYNWYAVNTSKLAPSGWHVATNEEWNNLIIFLGGPSVAGCKLKEEGTNHWLSPNTGATNEFGFTALPGSFRYTNGKFGIFGNRGFWWSSTEFDVNNSWSWYIYNDYENVYRYYNLNQYGFSVRCVKDE